MVLGAGAIVVLLGGAALMKSPAPGATAAASTQTSGAGIGEARTNPVLWMICGIQFASFTALVTIPLHIVVHGLDLGMTAEGAAALLSVMGAASIAGRLSMGAVIDRVRCRGALMLCFVPLIVSLLLLLVITAPWLLFVAVAVYGFAHGGFFTSISPTIAEYFGLKAHGTIFGVVVFFGTIGGAAGPILAGSLFDLTDSYALAFTVLAVLAAIGLALAFKLPRSSADL
jgi:fucose permease